MNTLEVWECECCRLDFGPSPAEDDVPAVQSPRGWLCKRCYPAVLAGRTTLRAEDFAEEAHA